MNHGKLIAICFSLAITLLHLGCAEQKAGTATAAATKPKIALVMKSLANEFFSTMAEGAKKHQEAHADQYDLVVNGIPDERDISRQVALVEEMVAAGANAIVIAPADSKALVPVLRRAAKEGVVIVNIDNRLDAEVLAAENLQVPFVGPDNRAGAKKVGDYMVRQLASGDKIAILEGITSSFNAQQRKLGFEEAAKEAGLQIVSSQSAEWETGLANTITSAMLQEKPEIKAILACNDNMALGAVAAINAAGLSGKVKVAGFDNISAVQEAIRGEKVLATADQHGDQLAVYGIEYALNLLKDRQAKIEDRETPVDLITAETLK